MEMGYYIWIIKMIYWLIILFFKEYLKIIEKRKVN